MLEARGYWEANNVDERLPHLRNKTNNSPNPKKENHKIRERERATSQKEARIQKRKKEK